MKKYFIVLLMLVSTSALFAQRNWQIYPLDSIPTMPLDESYTEMAFGGNNNVVKFGGSLYNGTFEFVKTETSICGVWTNTVDSILHKGITAPKWRKDNALAYIGNTNVVMFGGRDETKNFSDTWIYNSSTNKWTKKNPSNTPSLLKSTSVEMAWIGPDNGGDKALMIGTGSDYNTTAWIYDLSDDEWTELDTPPVGRRTANPALSYFGEDKVVLAGGYYDNKTAFIFDYSESTWTQIDDVKENYQSGEMSYLGVDDEGLRKVIFHSDGNNCFVLDHKNLKWELQVLEPTFAPRGYFGMAETSMDEISHVVAFGGGFGGNYYNTCLYKYSNSFAESDYEWNWGHYGDDTFILSSVWLQDTRFIELYKNAGVNVFIGFWDGISQEQLDDLREHDMQYIVGWNKTGKEEEQDELALANIDDKLFIAWTLYDEPDMAQRPAGTWDYLPCVDPQLLIDDYEKVKEADKTGRPVILNCSAAVAVTEANLRGQCAGQTDMYYDYYSACDIASYDIYPVTSPPSPVYSQEELWYIGQGVKNMKKWTNNSKEAYYFAMECTDMMDIGKPTLQQIWTETWMGVIEGGTGVSWFPYSIVPFNGRALLEDTEMYNAVKEVNKGLHENAVLINSEHKDYLINMELSELPVYATDVNYTVRAANDTVYLWAYGGRDRRDSNTATFTINGDIQYYTAEYIYGDKQQVEIVDNEFSIEFTGQDVHLIRLIKSEFYLSDDTKINNEEYYLGQNSPNPFSDNTKIEYNVPTDIHVNISLYNMLGEKVAELVNENVTKGKHTFNFDISSFSELKKGMYIYKMSTPDFSSSRKISIKR